MISATSQPFKRHKKASGITTAGLLVLATFAQGALILTYDAAALNPGTASGQSWDPTGSADIVGFTTPFASGTVIDTSQNSSFFSQAVSAGNSNANSITSFISFANNVDFSYEFWIRPSNLTDDHNIFETGGATIGTSITISGADIQATIRENNTANTVSHSLGLLPSEFIHIVATVDVGATAGNTVADDTLTLFINGVQQDTITAPFGGTVGGNTGNFGGTDENIARPTGFANPHVAFDGEIALANFYDTALTPTEVLANYNNIAVPEPSSLGLLSLALATMTSRRNRSKQK